MSEGSAASFDKLASTPYVDKPIPADRIDRVTSRIPGFPFQITGAVEQLGPSNEGILGRRIALQLPGHVESVEDSLKYAGAVVTDEGRYRIWRSVRDSHDLVGTRYRPVADIKPDEIDRVLEEFAAEQQEGNPTDYSTRFVGFIDATEDAGWKLGVVDTQEHTKTEVSYELL